MCVLKLPGHRTSTLGSEADDRHAQLHGVHRGPLHREDQGSQGCQVCTGGGSGEHVHSRHHPREPELPAAEDLPERGGVLCGSGGCRQHGWSRIIVLCIIIIFFEIKMSVGVTMYAW